MTTEKRARQKANRASRVAAAEAMAAKERRRSRLLTYGAIAALIVVAIIGVSVLTSDDDTADPAQDFEADFGDDTTTTLPIEIPPVEPVIAPTPTLAAEISADCPAADGSSERTLDFGEAPATCIDVAKAYTAVFDTSEGEVRVELDVANTPVTVNNFVTLARYGYYDETTIFRTDPSIEIIQGGAPHTESPSDPGPGYTIPDEPGFTNTGGSLTGPYIYEPGQLVMARSAGPDSSGAQFFFVTGEAAKGLEATGTYIVFGTTDESGLEVLREIIGLHEDDPESQLGGSPSRTVTINSVEILEA